MTNYTLGDFLIKVKNAALARQKIVSVPSTKLIYAVSELLKKENYLSEVKKDKDSLIVRLAYVKKEPMLVSLRLISKPGKRVYMKAVDLAEHKGLSFYIMSTPAGLLSSKEAVRKNIGGEVIAEIH